ncbi:uncharacterized protein LOC129745359 [Uranotaenia lowii]|uniref:uncharacterized protein LOC129745359 n=1 Tax=Uranotaenia lowii TaxID=190385 RepID=UPI002478B669|nr:uncharacterized protein LOC129745359 [Uranotaenia lowii]
MIPTRKLGLQAAATLLGVLTLFPVVVQGFPRYETSGCIRHSPSLNKCIERAVQYYISYLANGKVSDRTHVLSLDPLTLPNTTLVRNRNTHTYFLNREMRGFRNSFVTDVKSDFNKLEFVLQFHMPAVDVFGTYRAELAHDRQIAEWSKMFSSLRNSTLRMHMKGQTYEHEDLIYVRVNITDFDLSFGDHTVGFGWFTMSGNYSEHATQFDQERGRSILAIVESEFGQSFRERVQKLLNEILRLAPFERFFPSQ